MAKKIHLHWAYRLPPIQETITKAASVCGQFNLTKEEWTRHKDDANCANCLEIAERAPPLPKPTDALPPPVKEEETPKSKLNGKWDYEPGAIIQVEGSNPQKPGTPKYQRWQLIWDCERKPWEKFRDAGGNPTTLKNAIKMKKVKLL